MSGTSGAAEPFAGIDRGALPDDAVLSSGKVRDIIDLGSRLIFTTTDRISAFDRVLGTVPYKGEVLTALSHYWFGKTADIVANHAIRRISARSFLAHKCEVIPVEVVVRGFLTGSAWRDYQAGKPVSGIRLPEGLRFNQEFETPLVTPSTKESGGGHDEPISGAEAVERGLVDKERWREIQSAALSLYQRGRELCADRGLILVDTKYEFGIADGMLVLIDEIHTPDSSRFWYADSYQRLFEAGEKQRKLDKEYLRQWLLERGYAGEGEPPEIPDEVFAEVSRRYIQAYETITGKPFPYASRERQSERQKILSAVAEERNRL